MVTHRRQNCGVTRLDPCCSLLVYQVVYRYIHRPTCIYTNYTQGVTEQFFQTSGASGGVKWGNLRQEACVWNRLLLLLKSVSVLLPLGANSRTPFMIPLWKQNRIF